MNNYISIFSLDIRFYKTLKFYKSSQLSRFTINVNFNIKLLSCLDLWKFDSKNHISTKTTTRSQNRFSIKTTTRS